MGYLNGLHMDFVLKAQVCKIKSCELDGYT